MRCHQPWAPSLSLQMQQQRSGGGSSSSSSSSSRSGSSVITCAFHFRAPQVRHQTISSVQPSISPSIPSISFIHGCVLSRPSIRPSVHSSVRTATIRNSGGRCWIWHQKLITDRPESGPIIIIICSGVGGSSSSSNSSDDSTGQQRQQHKHQSTVTRPVGALTK